MCTRDYYFPPEEAAWAATRIFVALFGDPKYGIWTHGVPHVCALMDGLIHKHFIWINHRLVRTLVTIKLQYTIIAPRAQQFKDPQIFTVDEYKNMAIYGFYPFQIFFMWNHTYTTRFEISKK